MRVVPWVCLIGAALTGCKSAPKERPAPPASVPSGRSGAPFWADPNGPSRNPGTASIGDGSANSSQGDPVSQPGNDPEVSGILAGRLVDGFGRSPGAAYVQVSLVRDGRAEPIADVETVNQGHFYIRGLQPGRTYKLVARARQDGRLLVGEAQARPPETRLLIPLGEELAGANTPPIPTAPTPPKARPTSSPAEPPAPDAPWNNPAAGLGPPTAGGPDFGPADRVAVTAPPGPPTVNIPTPVAPPAVSPIQPQSFTPAPPPPAAVAAACVVTGGRVVTLRLPDPDGREWDFARRRGRLVLLDFWGTWCGPCLRAVPEVSRLHANYSNAGLEVVGIACERGSPADNARRVRDVRQRLRIGYELALADTTEQVQQQFRITHYPTLVLVDADGTIAWRGGPDQLRELDGIIRRKLGY